jgi:HPt (histidine-containing phosphotransfer) domain-containing protein
MIDRAAFDELYGNFDKEVVVDIIDIFINEYAGRMQAIEDAIVNADFDALNKRCHSLKGVVSNFYDEDTRSLAYALEQKGKLCDGSDLMAIYLKLKPATESLLIELKGLRNRFL